MAKAGDTGAVYVYGRFAFKIGRRGFERLNEEFQLQKQVAQAWQSSVLVVPRVLKMNPMACDLEGVDLELVGVPADEWEMPVFSMERISPLGGDPWMLLAQELRARGKAVPAAGSMVRLCLNWDKEINAQEEEIEIGTGVVQALLQGVSLKAVVQEVARFISFLHFQVKVDAQDFELYVCGPTATLVAVVDFSDMDIMLPPLSRARIVEAGRALDELQDVIPRPGSRWYRMFRSCYISGARAFNRESDSKMILKVFEKQCGEM